MKKRTAIDPNGKRHLFIGAVFAWRHGWEWFIKEIDVQQDLCFGFVQSPLCREGEWGYFSLKEIFESTRSRPTFNLRELMPPEGWFWLSR